MDDTGLRTILNRVSMYYISESKCVLTEEEIGRVTRGIKDDFPVVTLLVRNPRGHKSYRCTAGKVANVDYDSKVNQFMSEFREEDHARVYWLLALSFLCRHIPGTWEGTWWNEVKLPSIWYTAVADKDMGYWKTGIEQHLVNINPDASINDVAKGMMHVYNHPAYPKAPIVVVVQNIAYAYDETKRCVDIVPPVINRTEYTLRMSTGYRKIPIQIIILEGCQFTEDVYWKIVKQYHTRKKEQTIL